MRQQKMSRMPVKSEGINQGVGENNERATFMTNEEMEKKIQEAEGKNISFYCAFRVFAVRDSNATMKRR